MPIITIGIGLAKRIFKVSRDQLLPLIAHLPHYTIGIKASSGVHHWTRLFRVHTHTIKLMAQR